MTTLHAVLITPLTGPLALYGRTCATALTIWAKKAANLPATFTEVELDVQDTGDHLSETLQTTLEKRPDVLFGPYGSGPMLTVARSCTRLIWNHGGASLSISETLLPPRDQCALSGFNLFRERSSGNSFFRPNGQNGFTVS